jgi:hypothetical protein
VESDSGFLAEARIQQQTKRAALVGLTLMAYSLVSTQPMLLLITLLTAFDFYHWLFWWLNDVGSIPAKQWEVALAPCNHLTHIIRAYL